jgi:hypothetical protein
VIDWFIIIKIELDLFVFDWFEIGKGNSSYFICVKVSITQFIRIHRSLKGCRVNLVKGRVKDQLSLRFVRFHQLVHSYSNNPSWTTSESMCFSIISANCQVGECRPFFRVFLPTAFHNFPKEIERIFQFFHSVSVLNVSYKCRQVPKHFLFLENKLELTSASHSFLWGFQLIKFLTWIRNLQCRLSNSEGCLSV